MTLLKFTDACLVCPGETAFLMSEQFAFQEVFRDGGTIDGQEGLLAAWAVLIDGSGNEFLTRAAFPRYQDRCI